MFRQKITSLIIINIFFSIQLLIAQPPSALGPLNIGVDEKLGQILPENLLFVNNEGDTVRLGDLITKPTVITLIYFRCPSLCSTLLTGMTDVIRSSDLVPGVDYNLLTISFNHEEDWALGKEKKISYLQQLGRNIPPESWQFLVSDSMTIDTLTKAIGFKFEKVDDEYAHPALITVISPEAKIIRYLYGTDFLPFDFKLAISEAEAERPGASITKVITFCFAFKIINPQTLCSYFGRV